MDWLWYSLGRFGLAPQVEGLQSEQVAGLSALPSELILFIASMLPTSSAACLALCNRRLSQVLGSVYWGSLLHDTAALDSFLLYLQRDLPQHWICFRCRRLHQCTRVPWPRSVLNIPKDCVAKNHRLMFHLRSYYSIGFPQIQQVMRRHYYGPPHGFPLTAFGCTEATTDDRAASTKLLSVDARIVSNELLVRSQLWVLVQQHQRDDLVTTNLLYKLCCHNRQSSSKPPRDSLIPNLIGFRLHELANKGACKSQILQCLKCQMDYELEAVDFREKGIAVVLTKWLNLGGGINPADVKWHSHNHQFEPEDVIYEPHSLGGIRKQFEQQGGISVKDLTAENVAKLFSAREDRDVTAGADGYVWKRAVHGLWYLVPAEETSADKLVSFLKL